MRSCEDAAHVRATRGFALSWARSWYWLRGECGENNPTIKRAGRVDHGAPDLAAACGDSDPLGQNDDGDKMRGFFAALRMTSQKKGG